MTPVERLKKLAEEAISKDEWGQDRTPMTACRSETGEGFVWYDDGDLCAKVEDNMGLGISGERMAEFFAACDPRFIIQLCDHWTEAPDDD